MSPPPHSSEESFPWRLQLPIYASGFFNGNVYFLTGILMPLWAAIVVKEPFLIGVVVAARQVMPVLFAIHGGALMDRFGARRVMLIFTGTGIVVMAAFPFFPFLSAIIALQMLSGMAESMGWVGSQALVGKVLKGRPVYAGRLSFALRLGGFAGPWLAGLAWHHYGPAVGFYAMALWIAGGWIAGWLVPVTSDAATDDEVRNAFRWQELVPRWSDYAATFRMLGIPAVALVIAVTLMRQSGSGIQQSFYPIWLHQLGITAADIGLMVGFSHILSASTSLSVGYLTRWMREHWLLILTIGLSIVTMAITPMLGADFIELPGLGKIYFILFGAIALRGLSQGLNMPLMMSIGMQAVSSTEQGKIVALRITTNRLTTAIIPLMMGAIAQWSSLEASFYIVGGLGMAGLTATAVWVARSAAFRN